MTGQIPYGVAAFGVPDTELSVLQRVLGLSAERSFAYRLVQPGAEARADIVLVNSGDAAAVKAWRRAIVEARPRKPVTVVVYSAPAQKCAFKLQRPFMATRVLGTLDRAVHERLHGQTAAAAVAGVTASTETAIPNAEPRYRALVVDDSAAVRKHIGIVLERARVAAEFADNGEQALQMLDETGYDLVLLDVVMPGMDGYEVCRTIKRNRACKHLPVVMLTGKSSPFDKVKGKLSGCNSYLTKPVKREDFVETVKKYLKEPLT